MMCMILSDAVGNAEVTRMPIHWKMAVQVRRFNSQVIGLGHPGQKCFNSSLERILF